jgi:hypothetical protein
MKKLIGTFFVFCVFISFGYSQKGSHSVKLLGRAISNEKLVSELIGIYYAGDVKYSDITSLKIYNKNGVNYVTGEINEELPEVIYKSFVIFSAKGRAFIIGLSFPEVVDKINTSTYLLGGIYQIRGIGYYFVYIVCNDTFSLLFKSDTPVFNTSLGCESFKDGKLQLSLEDLNNDGCKDLNFKGTKLVYCDGDQNDRSNNQVLRVEDINFCYLFNCNSKIMHFVKCFPPSYP